MCEENAQVLFRPPIFNVVTVATMNKRKESNFTEQLTFSEIHHYTHLGKQRAVKFIDRLLH